MIDTKIYDKTLAQIAATLDKGLCPKCQEQPVIVQRERNMIYYYCPRCELRYEVREGKIKGGR